MDKKLIYIKFLIHSLLLLIVLPASASSYDLSAWSTQEFQAKQVNKNTLAIRGNINKGDYEKFQNVFSDKIKVVRISGPGGEVSDAVRMGLDLLKKDIHVIVDGPCLSSCANYLFLAGKTKVIEKNGFVGFHGSPWHGAVLRMGRQLENGFIDGEIPPTVQQEIDKALKDDPKLTLSDLKKRLDDYTRPVHRNERDFFQKIGVSDRLITNSLHGRFTENLPECRKLYPLSDNEKDKEPFLFVSTKQLSAYGVKGLSGQQDLKLAYELASLAPSNKRDDDYSFIFCLDAVDEYDWDESMSEVIRRQSYTPVDVDTSSPGIR